MDLRYWINTINMSPSPPTLSGLSPAPLLSNTSHSGVPQRLVAESARAKGLLYSNKTLPPSVARRRNLPLPPDISQRAYDVAIDELKQSLGERNVELNTQPLVDGWYMEHPYARHETLS